MIVLDANILIRAVLGRRVRSLIATYAPRVVFFAPEMAFSEAQEHLPSILKKRGVLVEPALKQLDRLRMFVESVPAEVYRGMEALAKERLDGRDDEDWPILALALTLGCPIWTEDTDFFGCGAPTWTTNRIEIFFAEIAK